MKDLIIVWLSISLIVSFLFIYRMSNELDDIQFELKNLQSVYDDYAEQLYQYQIDYHVLKEEHERINSALEGAEDECLRLRRLNQQYRRQNK